MVIEEGCDIVDSRSNRHKARSGGVLRRNVTGGNGGQSSARHDLLMDSADDDDGLRKEKERKGNKEIMYPQASLYCCRMRREAESEEI